MFRAPKDKPGSAPLCSSSPKTTERRLKSPPVLTAERKNYASLVLAAIVAAGLLFWLPNKLRRPEPSIQISPSLPAARPKPVALESTTGPILQESFVEKSAHVAPLPPSAKPGQPVRKSKPEPELPIFIDAMTPADKETTPEPETPKGSQSEWRIHGTVYDLLTCKPIAEADVVFTDPAANLRFPTATDSFGQYRAALPVNEDGYAITISHPAYAPKYADDEDGSVRRMSADQRSALAVEIAQTLQHKEMYKAAGGERVQHDFALVPTER